MRPDCHCLSAVLPVEILRLVFQYIAHQYVSSKDNLKQDHPSRFPFNAAGVCILWRDILGDFPEWWTDILILVDNTFPTSLSELTLYLSFSKGLPINVKVTRTKPQVDVLVGDVVKYNEIVYTKAVVEVLRPHFGRCKLIHFDVLYDTSLPSVTRDLLPLSPGLQTLILKSVYEHGSTMSNQQDYQGDEVSRADPRTLFLSGKTALEVLNHKSLFVSERWNNDVTISTCSAPDHESSASFLATLTGKFNDVAHLTLENLVVPFQGLSQDAATPIWRVHHLRLVDLRPNFLHFLFNTDLSMVLFISIIDCTLHENLPSLNVPNCAELELCRVGGDLGIVLASWDGSALTFNDCDELTNEIIHALTARIQSGRYSDLCRLEIINCQNFKPTALLSFAVSFGRARGACSIVVSGSAPQLNDHERTVLQSLAGVLRWEGESL